MFFQDCRTFLTQRLILQLLFPYEIAGVCAGRQRGVDCTDHRASKFGINFAQARKPCLQYLSTGIELSFMHRRTLFQRLRCTR